MVSYQGQRCSGGKPSGCGAESKEGESMKCVIDSKVVSLKNTEEAFDAWWNEKYGNRITGTRYRLAKKAWDAALLWAMADYQFIDDR